ncbi:MAG TPA: DUF1501 domain-containing protein [Pirellulales bacterium]|nr:DUF1501 domain-containing protein [Pirellulales bacterium]
MLTIFGPRDARRSFCDGVTRRSFLKVGGMALGGLSLPQLLAREAQAGPGMRHKSIINVFLPGGPPHQDMWDIKSQAPAEIRGEFEAIKTNVPGIEICELFPHMAAMMDKFVPVRTIVGSFGGHDGYQCMTGRVPNNPPQGGWPAAGAWVSKVQGAVHPGVPAHLSLMYKTGARGWGEPGTGGFLGAAHAPFRLVGAKAGSVADDMTLQNLTLERLNDRQQLLKSFDNFRREADRGGVMSGMDAYLEQAVGILTSSALRDALDLSKEDPRILARYGKNDPTFQRDGAPRMVENFCIARRLVEAGARLVSMNYSRWDWHGPDGKNFVQARQDMPLLDQALAALVTDLHERGLDRDVSVVVWGEFGRTPRINNQAGRDHWPQVSCAMLAGGGMRTGQVLGATDRLGGEVKNRPVSFQEVFATLYHNVGIDVNTVTALDLHGRPQYLLDSGVQPIRELI